MTTFTKFSRKLGEMERKSKRKIGKSLGKDIKRKKNKTILDVYN